MEFPGGAVGLVVGGLYLLFLAALLPFGVHRLWLVWLRLRRPPRPEATSWEGPLPRVTIQLPIYNEANVVERLIAGACGMDYPRDRLEVQVLDDSDDETMGLAAAAVASWRERGVEVRHLRRPDRAGFKAGALAYGAARARGEFLLILDADFLSPPDLVRRLLPPFRDPSVGATQAAWAHLNAEESWLTRGQSLLLDAHFAVEQEARYRSGLYFNFNGSAGMWRRECIEDAGGWRADTLTEDLDLSYRAQLLGWRLAYLDDVRVPAELPSGMAPLEVQQERWAQGGVQTARKLLPAVWRSDVRLAIKLEATAHLAAHAAHPPTLLLGVALCALGYLGTSTALLPLWVHLVALGLAMTPFLLFFGLAARLRGDGLARGVRRVAEAVVLGLGLGVPITFAVGRGLSGARTPFLRTPKRGAKGARVYTTRRGTAARALRGALALGFGGAIMRLLVAGMLPAVPFTGLFAAGYAATTGASLRREDGGTGGDRATEGSGAGGG